MIQYFRAFGSYYDFLDSGFLLTRKLANQGFVMVNSYVISMSQIMIGSVSRNHNPAISSFTSNTTVAISGAGTAYPSGVSPPVLVEILLLNL